MKTWSPAGGSGESRSLDLGKWTLCPLCGRKAGTTLMKSRWVVVSQSCASAVEFLGTNQDACRDVRPVIIYWRKVFSSGHMAQAAADCTAKRPFTHRPDAPLTMCDHHGGDSSQVCGLLHCRSLRCLLYVILPSYEQHPSPFKETEAQNS